MSDVHVAHAGAIATWTVQLDPGARWHVSNTTAWGTSRFRASELIDQALNGRTPTAYDEHEDGSRTINQQETIAAREKQQQLKDRFREWIWQDGERASRLAHDYNERFNNLRLRNFDGSHLTLPGMVRDNLRDRDLASPPSERRGLAHPAERQHTAGACGRGRKDLDHGRRLPRRRLAYRPVFRPSDDSTRSSPLRDQDLGHRLLTRRHTRR